MMGCPFALSSQVLSILSNEEGFAPAGIQTENILKLFE